MPFLGAMADSPRRERQAHPAVGNGADLSWSSAGGDGSTSSTRGVEDFLRFVEMDRIGGVESMKESALETALIAATTLFLLAMIAMRGGG